MWAQLGLRHVAASLTVILQARLQKEALQGCMKPSLVPYDVSRVHRATTLRRHTGLGGLNIGALRNRLGFWGILYHNHNKEPLVII